MTFFQCRKIIVVFATVFLVSISFGRGFANSAYTSDIKLVFKASSRQSVDGMTSGKSFSVLNSIFDRLLNGKNPHILNNHPGFESSKPFKSFNPSNSSNASKTSNPFKPSNLPFKLNQSSTQEKPGANNSTASGNTASFSPYAQEAVNLLNADRAIRGLSALKLNMTLVRLAEDYAQDMIERGFFSHETPEGFSPFDRMKKAGVNYRWAGENLAINSSVDAAQKAFMASAGHRANILNPNFTHVGIGVKRDARGLFYVVQEFIGI